MKKIWWFILGFILCSIITCLGVISTIPFWACLGAVASAFLGSIISIILNSIDYQGIGYQLWWQHIRYRKKEIRLSFSYLFRIQVDGKYLLIRGNRLKNQYQPIGGVYKYYTEAKPKLESFHFRPDVQMGNKRETDDLRIIIPGREILSFMDWFLSMKDREYDPLREFKEELLDTGLLPKEVFSNLIYRKVGIHNKGIQKSKYMSCDEFIYADIFELTLSDEQQNSIRSAVLANPEQLCLASDKELMTECYNGIEKNLGTNSAWIIGE